MEQKINFIYESGENKYLIGNLSKGKLQNKKYYFQNLENLEIEDNTKFFLQDNKFSYFQKMIAFTTDEKITIKDIEKEVVNINLEGNIFIGYNISDIKINGIKEEKLLGKTGEIEFTIGIYTLNKLEYNYILKSFGKNQKIDIYPNSLFLLKEITKNINNGNLVYFGEENIESINIKNGFYFGVEIINIGTKIFTDRIFEIFNKNLNSTTELSPFHKKVYEKELDNYLSPIILFLEKNIKGENTYIIGDFKFLPQLVEKISSKLKSNIIPIKLDNKSFSKIEQANIYCIKKYF